MSVAQRPDQVSDSSVMADESTVFVFKDVEIDQFAVAISAIAICFVALREHRAIQDDGGLKAALLFLNEHQDGVQSDLEVNLFVFFFASSAN